MTLAVAPARAAEPSEIAGRIDQLLAEGDYAQARHFAKGLVAQLEERAGKDSRPAAAARIKLAVIDERMGRYAAIPDSLGRALTVLAEPPTPVLAMGKIALAAHRRWRGETSEADALLEAAMRDGEGVPRVALSALWRRGELALALGDFERAEDLCAMQATRLTQQVDPGDPERVRAMSCWADALVRKGTVKTAKKVYVDAVSSTQTSLGADHPETARATLRLAAFYARTGAPKKGERLHERALALLDERFGPDNRFVIEATAALAEVLHHGGRDDDAAPLYDRAVAMARRGLGDADPDTARMVAARAHFAWCSRGDTKAALDLAGEALALRKAALGPNHRLVGEDLAVLADRRLATGDAAGAVDALAQANEVLDRDAVRLLATGSEGQKRVNAARLRELTERAVDLHLRSASRDPDAAKVALTALLRRKAIVLDALGGMHDLDGPARAVVAELRSLVSSAVVSRIRRGEDRTVGDQGWWEQARYFELRRAEARASSRSERDPVTVAQVAAALREGQALVEMVAYRPVDFDAPRSARLGPARYAAYVLRHGGGLGAVDLGPVAAIDELVVTTRRQIQKKDPAALASLRQLDERIMRPVRPLLDGAREIFVSPDGQLHLVPLQALRDELGNYLIESMALTWLTSGRELVVQRDPRPARQPPTIVAAPAYHGETSSPSDDARAVVDLRKMRFKPLAGTAEEASAIAGVFADAKLLTGEEASETALRHVAGPRLLHIATHGFFLPTGSDDGTGTRALVLEDEGPTPPPPSSSPPPPPLDDPLLQSGLALRGANVVPPRPSALGGVADDGLLTAMEAASLDLRGTKLVVLSACETGVGEVHNGEGVIGLRRAFALAGAETLVMSLWKVSDAATRDLMIDTFTRLARGGGRAEALRQAQLAALALPGREHPYYWAAFFAAGDPTSLDGETVTPTFPKAMPTYDAPGGVEPSSRGCQCQAGANSYPRDTPFAPMMLALLGALRCRRRPMPS